MTVRRACGQPSESSQTFVWRPVFFDISASKDKGGFGAEVAKIDAQEGQATQRRARTEDASLRPQTASDSSRMRLARHYCYQSYRLEDLECTSDAVQVQIRAGSVSPWLGVPFHSRNSRDLLIQIWVPFFFFLVVSLSRPRWMGSGEKREICDSVVREAFFLSGEIGQDTGGCQSLAPCFSYCSLGRFLMASWRQTDSTGHLLSHHVNLRTRQRATYLPTT